MKTTTIASDFVDGTDLSEEYTYDGNGRLTKDTNRGIASISYDQCNNLQAIAFTGTSGIEYVYAPDGTKLRTVHKVSGIGGSVTRDTTDYYGNLVLRNGHLGMYRFDGGYVSFSNDTIDGWHFYIQDYMGNNRMVVNSDGTVEQITHYYPYGGVIGEISTNENVQKYKFEGKELDRTFGLDNYDIHARQYFAMAPMWDRIDPLAEKYYGISPYSYCGGDPVNLGDYDGESIYMVTKSGKILMLLPTNDEFDDLIGWDGNDNLQYIQTRDQSTITSLYKSKTNGKNNKDNYALSDSPESKYLFEFFADVTDNEWSLEVFNNNGKTQYLLGTSNKEGETGLFYNTTDMKEAGIREEDMIWKVHSHSQMWGEGGTPGGSGFGPEWGDKIQGDKLSWIKLNEKFQKYHKPVPRTYVYHRKSRTYYQYKGNIGNILVQGGINSLK